MGRRVNLAELAQEDVPDDYRTPTTRAMTSSESTGAAGSATSRSSASPLPEPAAPPGSLPVEEVAANPLNGRNDSHLAGDEFDELVATIREHGVLQPLVVCSTTAFLKQYPDERDAIGRARWVALIGNRRLLAARTAGMSQVPILVNDDRVASMYEVMLVENSHRRDLGPMNEAAAMQQVLDGSGLSRRDLATRIGRTHTYVNQRLALLGLIPALREAFEAGRLKVERARELGGLPAEEQEAIAAAGPPYRRSASQGGNGVSTRGRRSISVSTPQKAAESIRRLFKPDELDELVRLLTEAPAADANDS